MKELMSITGINILDENTYEIILVSTLKVKPKKPSLMSLASGGLEDIQKAIVGDKQYKTVIPIGKQDFESMRLSIGSVLTIEVKPGELKL
jgi:hypothetical protein